MELAASEDEAADEDDEGELADDDEAAESLPPPDEHPDNARAPTAAAQTKDVPNLRVVITPGF